MMVSHPDSAQQASSKSKEPGSSDQPGLERLEAAADHAIGHNKLPRSTWLEEKKKRKPAPYWCDQEMGSDVDVFTAVAMQGVEELLSDSVNQDFHSVEPLLTERLGRGATMSLEDYLTELRTEAARLGARLGAAMALTPMRGRFESWLAQAIKEHGIEKGEMCDSLREFAAALGKD